MHDLVDGIKRRLGGVFDLLENIAQHVIGHPPASTHHTMFRCGPLQAEREKPLGQDDGGTVSDDEGISMLQPAAQRFHLDPRLLDRSTSGMLWSALTSGLAVSHKEASVPSRLPSRSTNTT